MGSFFRQKTLASLRGPEEMTITGRVASASKATSPVTGMRAALFRISVGEKYTDRERDHEGNEREVVVFEEITSLLVGDSLLIETEEGLVTVPAEDLEVRIPGIDGASAMPIDGRLPDDLKEAVAAHRFKRGLAAYQEIALTKDDAVRLTAVLAPKEGRPAEGDGRARWIARPDLGPMILYDESISGSMGSFWPRIEDAIRRFFR
ncbi:hypothetical protein [Polyangium spumosum]|uniref:Uncharacterized protein n=1 Tax=Polyangium spumosum TaxID=889282 RepID=A0A6N7PXR2_9BACT|nr:hypothetical protein [Polyangium spumosum]MRG96327.1 hypothetical protein [Polyangium spumosum]